MKKLIVIIITILIEATLIYVVSKLIGWRFSDLVLVGSVLIFGVYWLFGLNINQTNNLLNAGNKGWTGMETGSVKIFTLKVNSVILGQIIFIILSLILTVAIYFPYFF
ncbi:hypothetical protein CHH55_13175 [Niallia circulans]|jgi:hypothetical protein|uniref:Uncharacterized protein n=1 Tax=Niallia circulans TaxID=1397 RepID=A0A0J1LD26_NIACI|nr:hypothetical protein [Niallia circulans]KLV26835.1 hypothetical protein ABW02_09845 [Niallia circulans]MCM2981485.1 hypothetical protein [Niallia circulans]MDR4318371.1 hypothetical protein [Niallia circulans]MED3841111.1 hypothetical protein [Niallia circulans]MED4242343.1 hypothetical protein [Niallia circulans]